MEKLEQHDWQWLYTQVPQGRSVLGAGSHNNSALRDRALAPILIAFCAMKGLAEERVPAATFRRSFIQHEPQSRLGQKCAPDHRIIDRLLPELVRAYARTFPRGNKWHHFVLGGAWRSLKQNVHEARARHMRVFKESGLVAYPLMCAEAHMTAAYARAVCEEAYAKQNWTHSLLNNVQSAWPDAFLKVDFHFWTESGSWSQCYDCRCYYYNDEYFREQVYSLPCSVRKQIT